MGKTLVGAIAFCAVICSAPSWAVSVDLTAESFNQPTFTVNDLTFSGTSNGIAANVYSENGRGVGVFGGIQNYTTDVTSTVTEVLTLTFLAGAATDIHFGSGSGVSPFNIVIEAFAPGGGSLGTQTFMDLGAFGDISGAFGNQPIAWLTLMNNDSYGGYSIRSMSFNPIPIPAALPLFLSALTALTLMRRQRRSVLK